MNAVWVRPDVPGIDRVFAYSLPATISGPLDVGTIVRVPLQGRRVRGWVVPAGDDAPDGPLREIIEVVSAGPPGDLVAQADWVAWRYAGNPVALLRAASPPNRVREARVGSPVTTSGFALEAVAIPPTEDRRPFLRAHVPADGSMVIVVPSASRAHALVREFADVGVEALAFTSAQRDAERTAAWRRMRGGRCIVIGGRIAVWAPVPDLAQLVVLDEGDEALAEERAPTWHARDVAVERARRAEVPIALVSPAPSLEARALADPVVRPGRAEERAHWPTIEIVDRRDEEHRVGILTVPFAAAAHRALDAGTRVLAVVNRKGRVRLYACADCHEIARCEQCSAAVVEQDGALRCPRCGTTRPRVCARCFGSRLKVLRAGVTRLADDLRALLPHVTVADVDAGTDAVPDADVYIGTEALLHRVPRDRRTGLVAFLEFDQEITAPRVRASEEAQWLLVRAARLVGARARQGRVLVQTSVPDHPVLRAARDADPLLVADSERPVREQLGFPPYGGLALVRGESDAVRTLCELALTRDLHVIGPTAQGDVLTALVRAPTPEALAEALNYVAPAAREIGRVRIEVDPQRA